MTPFFPPRRSSDRGPRPAAGADRQSRPRRPGGRDESGRERLPLLRRRGQRRTRLGQVTGRAQRQRGEVAQAPARPAEADELAERRLSFAVCSAAISLAASPSLIVTLGLDPAGFTHLCCLL